MAKLRDLLLATTLTATLGCASADMGTPYAYTKRIELDNRVGKVVSMGPAYNLPSGYGFPVELENGVMARRTLRECNEDSSEEVCEQELCRMHCELEALAELRDHSPIILYGIQQDGYFEIYAFEKYCGPEDEKRSAMYVPVRE